ncbi:hypothetical protein [Erwinia sp. INIA01]
MHRKTQYLQRPLLLRNISAGGCA